ncbi:hypothetical protein WA158_006743 [Blastocystis sp. Blastoise]
MTEIVPNVFVLQNRSLKYLMTVLRDKNTSEATFRQYADRVHRILVEEAITYLPSDDVVIETPCGKFNGCKQSSDKLLAISIIRAGDSLLQGLLDVLPDIKIGKILIQRDEKSKDKTPILYIIFII